MRKETKMVNRKNVISRIFSIFGRHKTDNVRTLKLKNSITSYPKEWIALHNVLIDDVKAEHAAMLGVTNSHIYNVPVFIFGCDIKRIDEYPKNYIPRIYEACQEAWSGFRDIVNLEPDPKVFRNIDFNNW